MRIRKHAKISPLVYAQSSLKPGTVLRSYDCQLNQSPWDVMDFSPPSSPLPPPPPPLPLFQEYENEMEAWNGNGSSMDPVSVIEIDKEFPSADKDGLDEVGRRLQYSDDGDGYKAAEEQPPCCKTDGKSWHCPRHAAPGSSMCEHHVALLKTYATTSAHPPKKSPPPPADQESRRRSRPKKVPTSTKSNPYEFYYYSGFNPRWGKKRGEIIGKDKDNGGIVLRNLDHDHEMATAQFEVESEEEEDLVYVEEEEEDEEDERDRKRARKPVKARSLKSLM